MTTAPTQITFMGQQFDTREALARAFPGYGGDEAIRAIRAGCTTVMEVELWSYRRRGRRGTRAAAEQPKVAKAPARRRKAA